MRISIIGLGWLGQPLAEYLLQKGFDIKGSTTSSEKAERLKKKGINAYPFFLNPGAEGEGKDVVFDTDILVVNIPPQSRAAAGPIYLEQIRELKRLIQKEETPKVVFVSATSVYPDLNQEAAESDELMGNTGNAMLLEAENILRKDKSYALTIIRLGGLLGDDRIPGVNVSNKEGVVGDSPVNYIYRHDAVRLVSWIIEKDLWDETYNGVAPFHPSRKEVYEKNAATLGFAPPLSYETSANLTWKRVSSEKIRKTGFTFLHHPLHFPYIFPKP